VDFSVSNAIAWAEMTGADGYRLDAVKHIEDAWLLELRARITDEVQSQTGNYFYMVGETFTGERDTIKYYVNADMLDGQFDFPLRMEMARTLLMRQGGLEELASFMDGNDTFYGTSIMSTFIGNHDIPRCIHLAEDTPVWDNQWTDGKDLAWNNRPTLPSGTSAFERLGNAFTILLTTRGAPLIYYGDEYGMPGAGDPDNRRFMQWDNYSAGQTALFDHIARLSVIRGEHPATRRGSRTTLSADADTFAYVVESDEDMDTVWVAVNRADGSRSVGGLPDGDFVDELTGDTFTGPSISLGARQSVVLVRP
jgi:glycosidase